MKAIVLVAFLLALFAIVFPILSAVSNPILLDRPVSDGEELPDTGGDTSLYYGSKNQIQTFDEDFSIDLLNDGQVIRIPLHDYLTGAVAAEMPASFEPEALKAQAVAIRTYVLYKILVSPSDTHPDADICSDSTCCAAWKSEDYLREKWGADYDSYSAKIAAAVSETDGQYISYDDAPALAVFHSSSSGHTESSSEVWSSALPYLVSVDSPEGETTVPNYISSVTVSAQEFKETVLTRYPEAVFSDDPSQWLGDITYTDSGRIHSINIGGVFVSGTVLRSMFSLRSTAVSISSGDNTFTMTSTGYGHGVGMSQYGANVLASSGSGFEDILSQYYPGTQLLNASDLSALS